MTKYTLEALETFETVTPASEMIFHNLLTGEEVGKRLPVPESRHTTIKGYKYTAKNKADRDKLLKSGKWRLVDA